MRDIYNMHIGWEDVVDMATNRNKWSSWIAHPKGHSHCHSKQTGPQWHLILRLHMAVKHATTILLLHITSMSLGGRTLLIYPMFQKIRPLLLLL